MNITEKSMLYEALCGYLPYALKVSTDKGDVVMFPDPKFTAGIDPKTVIGIGEIINNPEGKLALLKPLSRLTVSDMQRHGYGNMEVYLDAIRFQKVPAKVYFDLLHDHYDVKDLIVNDMAKAMPF